MYSFLVFGSDIYIFAEYVFHSLISLHHFHHYGVLGLDFQSVS